MDLENSIKLSDPNSYYGTPFRYWITKYLPKIMNTIKIQDKKGVFTSIGLRYEFRRTETIGSGFETCTEEDYEDLTCSGVSSTGSSQSYWKDGYTKLVNKEYYGFSLGLGALGK